MSRRRRHEAAGWCGADTRGWPAVTERSTQAHAGSGRRHDRELGVGVTVAANGAFEIEGIPKGMRTELQLR